MRSNGSTNSEFSPALALILGATAGFAAGLLTARTSGAKLRAEIGDAVDDYLGTLSQKADALRSSVAGLTQQAADRVNNVVDTGAQRAHGAIDNTVAAMNSAAQKGHVAVNDTANALRS